MGLEKSKNVFCAALGCAAIDPLRSRRFYLAQKKQCKFSAVKFIIRELSYFLTAKQIIDGEVCE
jgi:hypothetical protein